MSFEARSRTRIYYRATYDNVDMLDLLLHLGVTGYMNPVNGGWNGGSPKSALQMAQDAGAIAVANRISAVQKKSYKSALPAFSAPDVDDGVEWDNEHFQFSVVDDAQKMLKKLEWEADRKVLWTIK